MESISRREFLGVAGTAALRTSLSRKTNQQFDPRPTTFKNSVGRLPNIIFILADDLGIGDLGCYGQRKFSTPNIDRLGADGIRFTNAYSGAAVCAPSRCCLMTGKHTGHARIRANFRSRGGGRVSLEPDDVTVAEVLKRAGYRTGCIGKWGIGEAGTFGIPNNKGFDEWFGFLNQDDALHYYPQSIWYNRSEIFPPGNQGIWQKDYVQNMFTSHAIRFLERNRDNPFFLYLPYTLPHASSEIGRQTGDGYAAPYAVPDYGPFARKDWPKPAKGYAEMVHMLDEDVGRVRMKIKQLSVESNTVVFFSSDNGPDLDLQQGLDPKFFNSGAGLRGGKETLYEGGIRAPMIVSWPEHIRPGTTSAVPWAFWDFLPTAAEIAGLPFPQNCDGISIASVLFGEASNQRQNSRLYWESYDQIFTQAARVGDWKIIRTGMAGEVELYNLSTDPSETHNRAAEHPEIVRKMLGVLEQSHLDDPDYDIKVRHVQKR